MDDSTISGKLVDSLRVVSAAVVSSMTGITAVSVYLLQRSIRYFANPPDIPRALLPSNDRAAFQISFWGLQFGYETLTLVWPAVLGGLCFAASSLLKKRRDILEHLRELNPNRPLDLLEALDPLLVGSLVNAVRARLALRIMAFLPMFALVPHFVSAALAFVSVLVPRMGYHRLLSWNLPLYLFVLVVLIAASGFGFLGARDFLRAIGLTLVHVGEGLESRNRKDATSNLVSESTPAPTSQNQ